MKISRAWLQNFFDAPLPSAEDLAHALTFHAFEIESIEGDILDVKITANRGHDCLSHRGIAKELSAILQLPLNAERDPLAKEPDLSKKTGTVAVSIESDLCLRYVACHMKNVKVGPSPEWLKSALESIGQRSINNVVDATNFVMFNTGQPLHAFDAGKLSLRGEQYAIRVRMAKDGEKMVALDGKDYSFTGRELLITDAHSDTPIGIAGVKGGAPCAVSEETTDIILESANFDGVSVRKTAQYLKLRSDASSRFEQVISPELAGYGMQEVVDLISALAGGEVQGFVDERNFTSHAMPIAIKIYDVNAALGTKIHVDDMEDIFERLDFKNVFTLEVGNTVTPPFQRLDVLIKEDLIEEVGRIYGYDKVPEVELPPMSSAPEVNANFYWQEKVREFLVERGFSEVYTPVFADKGDRVVLNKVDGVKPYLRSNLIDGLREALERNVRLKELLVTRQIRIFEIGTVWKNGGEEVEVEIAVEKVKGEPTEEELRAELRAFLSSIDPMPETYTNLPASLCERYQPFSKFPFIVRDIAMWIEDSDDARGAVLNIFAASSQGLLRHVNLFDQYKKDGKTSLAFRLVFQSYETTLTDEVVNGIMREIQRAIEEKGWQVR